MDAKELRLGNLVTIENPEFWKDLSGKTLEVNGINIARSTDFQNSNHSISVKDEHFSYSQFNEFISGIPLIEEWVLKFGFNRFPWGLVKGNILFKDNLKNPCEELTLEVGNGFRVTVKYVHQFQNLYFALTGEELILK